MYRKTVKVYTIQTTKADPPSLFKDDEIDFDNCNLSAVIKFLQKLAKTPDALIKHITDALIKAREEKLKLETSIPRKLEDGWEPTIKMKINDFDCNALCDLGASVSVMLMHVKCIHELCTIILVFHLYLHHIRGILLLFNDFW